MGYPTRISRLGLGATHRDGGFTLVEVLVAASLSLIVVALLVNMFASVGRGVSVARNTIDLEDRLRAVTDRLQKDLQGATAAGCTPPLSPERDLGYFEIIEGPRGGVTPISGLGDDHDDIVAFTTRSVGEPFAGRWVNPATGLAEVATSQVAEVVYFVRDRKLYRRQLLVAPGLDVQTPVLSNADPYNFYAYNDISVRQIGGPLDRNLVKPPQERLVANSLGDLTKRENRYGHQPFAYPHDARFWGALGMPTLRECSAPGWPFPYLPVGNNGAPTGVRATLVQSPIYTTDPYSLVAVPEGMSLVGLTAQPEDDDAYSEQTASLTAFTDGLRVAEDVILENVVGFDAKVLDTAAPHVFKYQDESTPLVEPLLFDFQRNATGYLLADGYRMVTKDTMYGSSGLGYGWRLSEGQWVKDGGQTSDKQWQALRYDHCWFKEATFSVDLAPGIYRIAYIFYEPPTGSVRDEMYLYMEDVLIEKIPTLSAGGSVHRKEITIPIPDGRLDVYIKDEGGSTPNALINGLEIRDARDNNELTPVVTSYAKAWDFGKGAAASGYIYAPEPTTSYEGGSWSSGKGAVGDTASMGALLGDFAFFPDSTFTVTGLPFAGTYQVTMNFADPGSGGSRVQDIYINKIKTDTITVTSGAGPITVSRQATVAAGGQITVRVVRTSGTVANAVINGISITGSAPPPDVSNPPLALSPADLPPRGMVLLPGDPRYLPGLVDTLLGAADHEVLGYGAFVDLNYLARLGLNNEGNPTYPPSGSTHPPTLFGGPGSGSSWLGGTTPFTPDGDNVLADPPEGTVMLSGVYDTGCDWYERDGFDQDGSGVADDAAPADPLAGTTGAREAPPPYAVPLRGVQIRIRVEDPASHRIREVTVAQDYKAR